MIIIRIMTIVVKLCLPIKGLRYPPWFYESIVWQVFARKVREDREYRCECCHGKGWQVHHRFYPAIPNKQKRKYVTLLCERCHWSVHFAKWLLPFRWALGRVLHG